MNATMGQLNETRSEEYTKSAGGVAILTLPILLLLLTTTPVFGHSTTTHEILAYYAALKAAGLTTPVNFSSTQRALLEQGAHDEDTGPYGISTRPFNHAYNPVSGEGFTNGNTTRSEILTRWSSMTDAFAAGHFYGGDESGAWHYLGRASHLMQDMTAPLHAFAVSHPPGWSCQFEDYWGEDGYTLRTMLISDDYDPLHSSTLDAKATERLDAFSASRLQERFNNSSLHKTSDDPRGWVETMVWSGYFRATFWGQIKMGGPDLFENVNGAATSATTTSTTFSDGTVSAQINVLETMFGHGKVRWINNFIGDDYYEITDRKGYVFRFMSAWDIDDWAACGPGGGIIASHGGWGAGQEDGSRRVGGDDDDSDGVRVTGRFWFDVRELGKGTSGKMNRYCYPRYYPNGNPMTEHLHQYIGNYLYPLTMRYNAGLLGLANRRVTVKTANGTPAIGFSWARKDNFGNPGTSGNVFSVCSTGSNFFFVAKSSVSLTAPASNTGGMPFLRWLRDGSTFSGNTSRTITINDTSLWIPAGGVTYAAEYAAAPIILSQPIARTNNLGSAATFSVSADGTPPLSYQWRRNQVNLVGATDASLVLSQVQEADEGLYSVVVSNPFGSAVSSNALLVVNQPPIADAGATRGLIIACNYTNATVILNGTRSFDPDGDLLRYAWYEKGTPLASGAVAVVVLPVGVHPVLLVVNDGMLSATNALTIRVMTPAQAIEELMAQVASSWARSKPLLATLSAAMESQERGNFTATLNQLRTFQHKVSVQVARSDPALAQSLIQAARSIVEALDSCQRGRSGRSVGRVTLEPHSNGRAAVRFSAEPGPVYLIEASTNLVRWEVIGVAADQSDGTFRWEEQVNKAKLPMRFYRIRVQ